MSGILQQPKIIPVKMCAGITLDLHCADILEFAQGTTAADLATSYEITEPVLLCEVIELDFGLQEQYVQFVLTQSPLPVVYSQYITTEQNLTAGKINFTSNLARGCSRLQSVFWSLQETTANTVVPKTTNFYRPNVSEDFQRSIRIGGKNPLYHWLRGLRKVVAN